MNARDDVTYRLALSAGFLAEAEQDAGLERWRSCVDNAQLAVENAGKAVLAVLGVTPKTHDPARSLAVVLRQRQMSEEMHSRLANMLPDLLALGANEHFLTDYGDETEYTLPWELFDEEAAQEALAAARRSLEGARGAVAALRGDPPGAAGDSQVDEEADEPEIPAEEPDNGQGIPRENRA